MEKGKYRTLSSYLIARPARLSPFRFVVPVLAPMPSLEEVNLRWQLFCLNPDQTRNSGFFDEAFFTDVFEAHNLWLPERPGGGPVSCIMRVFQSRADLAFTSLLKNICQHCDD